MKPVHYGYLMAIKALSWTYKPANGGYLPYRTYIWKGGKYKADLKLADGVTPDPKAGQDWCFVFGEREWVGGKSWEKTQKIGKRYAKGKPEKDTIDPRVPCS